MNKLSLIILFSIIIIVQTHGQTLNFEIFKQGNKIGEVTAQKIIDGKNTNYNILSNISFHLISKYHVEFMIEAVYLEDVLDRSEVKDMINGKVKDNSITTKIKNGYQYSNLKDKNCITASDINYSISKLYFHPPKEMKSVYSEKSGVFLPIEKINDHEYLVILPNGNKNYYTFNTDGICTKLVSKNGIKSFEMRLLNITH
ncbi:DUF6134 family protein [Aureibacter tunicatorum]|uniref:Uncharacterized protein n=1 Tax=Aureibacter tunicatorum TaxID=866807 RepID=A0AAE3XPC6_9BACT|nr:DUF6134 family protein [Aureibacter tunicatorum]MDR6239580.1 hypothetical protein [Aureibacter tunicatorum]BDD04057.1 hypothetical protein AUTU_15400 [Aureibacter tunicatorum]